MLPENAGNVEKIRNVQQRQAKASFIFILRVRSCFFFLFCFVFFYYFYFVLGIYILTAAVSSEDIRAVFLQVRLVLDCDLILSFITWPCLKRTGNKQIQEFNWLKSILTAERSCCPQKDTNKEYEKIGPSRGSR